MNRDPYPFHRDGGKYDPAHAARMAAAVARYDARKAREAAGRRLGRLIACALAVVVGVLMFYGAAGDVLTLSGFQSR